MESPTLNLEILRLIKKFQLWKFKKEIITMWHQKASVEKRQTVPQIILFLRQENKN